MADPVTVTRYGVKPERVSLPLSGGLFGTVPESRTDLVEGIDNYTPLKPKMSGIKDSFVEAQGGHLNSAYITAGAVTTVGGTMVSSGLIATSAGPAVLLVTSTGGLVLIPIAAGLVAGAAVYTGSVLSDDSQIISAPIMDRGRMRGLDIHILPDTYKGMDVKTIKFEVGTDDSGKPIMKMFESGRIKGHGSWLSFDTAEIPELIEKGSRAASQSPFHIEGHPPGSPGYNYIAAAVLADQIQREPNYQHFTNLAYLAATHLKTLDPEQNLDPNARVTQQSVRNIYANALAERKKTITTDPAPVKNGPEDFLKLGLSIAEALDKPVETVHLKRAYSQASASLTQYGDRLTGTPQLFPIPTFNGNSSSTKDSFIKFARLDPDFKEGKAQQGIFPKATVGELKAHLYGDNGQINEDARNIYNAFYTSDGTLKTTDITDQEATKLISNRIAVYFGKTIEAGADGVISPEEFEAGLKQ